MNDSFALTIHGLTVDYGRDRALEEATLEVRPGEFVGILGPNGGGKTTLLRGLLGLVLRASGEVRIFGTRLEKFRDWTRLAYVPQNASQIDSQFPATALEAVQLGRVARRGLLRWLSQEDREEAMKALQEVEAAHLAHRRIGSLSGGERQRVLLAKALAGEPELLLLDEPTTGVDPEARADFYELLDHLNHTHGLTVLFVSHDTEAIAQSAHRIVAINRRIVFDGPSEAFRDRAHVSELYKLAISHGERRRHLPEEARP